MLCGPRRHHSSTSVSVALCCVAQEDTIVVLVYSVAMCCGPRRHHSSTSVSVALCCVAQEDTIVVLVLV